MHKLPQPQEEQLAWLNEGSVNEQRIAVALAANVRSTTHGVWLQRGEQRIWQLTLHAQDARTLGFQIDALGWSDQAELILTDSHGLRRQQLRASDLLGSRLWTAQFPSDSVTLELSMPLQDSGELVVNTAYFGAQELQHKHGNCNIDVACPNNEDAADQIDSTVLLQYAVGRGVSACSGFVVNNMRQDRAPYILTADHCQINRSVQDSVRVYWKFQDNQCGNVNGHTEGDPEDFPSSGGVEVLAEGQDSDFTLLILGSAENPRAIPQSFDPYWSGWNVGDAPPQFGIGVHHPQGDEKSISFFDFPASAVIEDISQGDGTVRTTRSWRVFWNQGTTEQGSSGSGLWNQDGLAVGVLSGGGASCSSQSEPDFYGRLNAAWEEGEACERQLKFWLDPDDSGAVSMSGLANGNAGAPRIPTCIRTNAGGGSSSGSVSPFLLFLLFLGLVKKVSLSRVKL
ncbi:MAG: trypsin-like serine peptidase [Oceanococcus sp.]